MTKTTASHAAAITNAHQQASAPTPGTSAAGNHSPNPRHVATAAVAQAGLTRGAARSRQLSAEDAATRGNLSSVSAT